MGAARASKLVRGGHLKISGKEPFPVFLCARRCCEPEHTDSPEPCCYVL